MKPRPLRLALYLVLPWVAACNQSGLPRSSSVDEHRKVHVDSTFSIEEEIRRFKALQTDSVHVLAAGAQTRDELVTRFVTALEAGNREALDSLAITSAEFAYLYYPHTKYTARPYELSPGLVWFQLQNHGARGLDRALNRYGGKPLKSVAHVCDSDPEIEGRNRIWTGCRLVSREESGNTLELSLFGPILERDGQFKFISYANRL